MNEHTGEANNEAEHDPREPYRDQLVGTYWELPSEIKVIEAAALELEERLRKSGWDEDQLLDVVIVFHEGLVNAITHGSMGVENGGTTAERKVAYRNGELNHRNKAITVEMNVTKDDAVITIADSGKGFDWKKVVDPTNGDKLLEESGRGLYIMSRLSDSIRFNDRGNRVTIAKHRKPITT